MCSCVCTQHFTRENVVFARNLKNTLFGRLTSTACLLVHYKLLLLTVIIFWWVCYQKWGILQPYDQRSFSSNQCYYSLAFCSEYPGQIYLPWVKEVLLQETLSHEVGKIFKSKIWSWIDTRANSENTLHGRGFLREKFGHGKIHVQTLRTLFMEEVGQWKKATFYCKLRK